MASEHPVILITGATGKLGRSFALGFSGMGWSVAFTTRGGGTAKDLERECLVRGSSRVAPIKVDLTDDDAPTYITQQLTKMDMLPEVLINNARDQRYLAVEPNGRTSRPSWHGELLLGIVLPYELTMNLADVQSSPLRAVINIGSIYGLAAANRNLYVNPSLDSPVNYGVAKAALLHLTKELAVRLATRKIVVNAVSYGGVKGRADATFEQRYAKLCPAGRMLEESEVFAAVRFLASSESSGMTGHNLVVDGGWTIW